MQCLLSQSRSLVWLREGDTINHSSFHKLCSTLLQKGQLRQDQWLFTSWNVLLLLAKCLEGLGGGCVCNSHKSLEETQTRRSQKHTTNVYTTPGRGRQRERETEEKE